MTNIIKEWLKDRADNTNHYQGEIDDIEDFLEFYKKALAKELHNFFEGAIDGSIDDFRELMKRLALEDKNETK